MSKPAKAGTRISTPFIKDEKLMIRANEQDGRIVSFEVTIDGKRHVVAVKGNKITEAFKKVEKLTEGL